MIERHIVDNQSTVGQKMKVVIIMRFHCSLTNASPLIDTALELKFLLQQQASRTQQRERKRTERNYWSSALIVLRWEQVGKAEENGNGERGRAYRVPAEPVPPLTTLGREGDRLYCLRSPCQPVGGSLRKHQTSETNDCILETAMILWT